VTGALQRYDATLLLDDTQAIGVLGADAGPGRPFGLGGGGSVRNAGTRHDRIVAVASLAKAFGAPLACIAGPARTVVELATTGSALHSSPPSAVDIAAAAAALASNDAGGDRLRARLATRVRVLRGRAAEHGLVLVGGMFPVQSTGPVRTDLGRRLLARLAADDVHAVLRRTCGGGSAVTLVVTVAHHRSEVDRAAAVLGLAWQELGGRVRRAR
jgi:8-amino-7-oxononanoate synthase